MKKNNVWKRVIVTGAAVMLTAGIFAGCGSAKTTDTTSNGTENTAASDMQTEGESSDATATVSATDDNTLVVGNMGNSIKPAIVVLASELGYYENEGINVSFENISDLNAGLSAIEAGKMDILPLGVIPTVTFDAQGSELVIYGGTIAEGSQAVVTAENADTIKDIKDYAGKTVACVRPETGHMIAEDLMREAGVDVDNEVTFVELDGFQSVIEAVMKGTADVGFVNSGFGQVAEQQGLVVAMNVGDLAPNAVCCRQTTSKSVINEKRDALVKFQIANLEAYYTYLNDQGLCIDTLVKFSGQSEEYVDYCLYADVMKITMDPAKNRVQDFYEVMVDNGDIDTATSQWNLDEAVDSTIYKEALDEVSSRYPNDEVFSKLQKEYTENNE